MPRVSPIQGDFSGGEFSPLLYGRSENPRYKTGLALCQNIISMLQGPITRRAGSVYVAPTKSTGYTRLIPFKYSVLQDYQLEFGDLYVRFYTQRSQIIKYSFSITAANANAGAIYSNNGQQFTIETTITAGTTLAATGTGNPSPSGTLTKVSGTGDATITFSSFAFVPYELVTPFTAAELPDVKYSQSLDVLYLVHPKHPPMTLSRYGNEDWALQKIVFKDGPYLDMGLFPRNRVVVNSPSAITGFFISAGAVGATVTVDTSNYGVSIANVTDNGAGGIRITLNSSTSPANYYGDRSNVFISGVVGATAANGNWTIKQITPFIYDLIGSTFSVAYVSGGVMVPGPFLSTDIGRLIRYGQFNSTSQVTVWAYLQITNFTDYAHVSGQVVFTDPDFDTTQTTGTSYYAFGVYSDSDGYPSCVVFHEDRLWFGAPGISLIRLDGSNTSDYTNFSPSLTRDGTTVASNAVSFSLNSHDGDAIVSMKSDELGMPVLTKGGPWILRPSILSEAISPTNVSAKKVNNVGSSSTEGVTAAKATIYLERSTRKLRELTYFYQIGGFRSIDISEVAEHLPAQGISTEIVYQSIPQPILWCARADGTLLGATYDRELDALRTGWHRHYLGGRSDTSNTPPLVKSLSVIPSPDGTSDDVWLITQRFINGAIVQYVEYLSKIFQEFDEQQTAFFSDCGATFDISHAFSAITNAFPAVVTQTAHGFITGNIIRFTDVVGLRANDDNGKPTINTINNVPFTITVIDANHYSLNGYDSSDVTLYTTGTGRLNKQVTTISGINWLEGETVNILADGAVLPQATVTSGAIHLDYPAGVVNFGLPIKARLQQLVIDAGSADGTSLGKTRRMNEVALMLNRSGSFRIGTSFDPDKMFVVNFREPSDPMDAATPLFSGTKNELTLYSDYNLYNQLSIEIDDPSPFTLIAILPQLTAYDNG